MVTLQEYNAVVHIQRWWRNHLLTREKKRKLFKDLWQLRLMQNLNKKMTGLDKFKPRDKSRRRSRKQKPVTPKDDKESKESDKKEDDDEGSNKEGGSHSGRPALVEPDKSDSIPTGGNNFVADSDSSQLNTLHPNFTTENRSVE